MLYEGHHQEKGENSRYNFGDKTEEKTEKNVYGKKEMEIQGPVVPPKAAV